MEKTKGGKSACPQQHYNKPGEMNEPKRRQGIRPKKLFEE